MTTYLKDAPAPTPEQLAEIATLEAGEGANLKAREDSFERSDTDGFLSQWASGINADLKREQANLLRSGGHHQFPVLCDAAGNVVADKVHRFADRNAPDQWNHPTVRRWKLPEQLAAQAGRRWIPCGEKSRIQKQLGLHEEMRWFPAYAKITTPPGAKSTGLGGCANAYVGVFRRETSTED